MKILKISLPIVLLLICGTHQSQASIAPTRLSIEYIRNTHNVKIADPLPEYSWQVPQQAVTQTAFQVLVSSSKKKLTQNIGDIWDSKKINSSNNINVEHGDAPLKPNSDYFWKVRIWDKQEKPSKYSEVQPFKTGSFNGSISTPNSLVTKQLSPQRFNELPSGSYFIDFGKDAFGTLVLTYNAKSNETLTIRLGEKAKQSRVDRKPGGSIRYQQVKLDVSPKQTHYVVQLPANAKNTNRHAIPVADSMGVIVPFRYAEIENATQKISSTDVKQRVLFHYFEDEQSRFSSSDSVLNEVWDLSKYSIKATSAFGLYVDGDRERIPYEADAYINQLSHYSVDNEYAMAKQTIEYFMDHPTWPTEWLLHTALMMYQDYYHTGDTELIAAYYNQLKHKTLIELSRKDGLISTHNPIITDEYMDKLGFKDPTKRLKDLVDWPPSQKDTNWQLATEEGERDGYEMLPVNTVVNSLFYENMIIMTELATIIEKHNDAKQFKQLADNVKKSINNKLFDKSRGIYIDGEGSSHASLHANMMPLAFNLVPKEHISTVVEFIKSRGMACSVYGAQYLLEGLYKVGEAQYALELMRATHDRSWYNMIKVGSTITMEAWDMKYKPNSDWNHAWGAAPANIVGRYMWGIQPKTPGFTSIIIHPQMADLDHSEIEVPTLFGKIKGSYKLENTGVRKFNMDIPGNTTAEFVLDKSVKKTVLLNGKKVTELPILKLQSGSNEILID